MLGLGLEPPRRRVGRRVLERARRLEKERRETREKEGRLFCDSFVYYEI